MTAFSQGDPAKMSSLYTENGQLLPTGSDFITSRPAIQAFWQMVMEMGVKSVKLETVELEEQGRAAIEIGKYELGDAKGKTADSGKYLVVWKKEDDQWRLHRDIWNSSLGGGQG